MRFGLVHRIMTDALAALGVLAIVSTATLSTTANAVLLLGLATALLVPPSWQTRTEARHVAGFAPLAIFFVQLVRLVAGHAALDVAVEFAALLQIVRLATRRGAAHDQQIIVLALLHLLAGTVLGGSLTFGLCFLGFVIVAPGALVLSHLRREVEGNYRQGARDRTGLPVDVPRILRSRRVVGRGFLLATCLLSVPIILFTIALFVVFPRVGLSLFLLNHSRPGRMVGFSDHVDLGAVGTLRSDPTVALRFVPNNLSQPPPTRMTLRLRGTAFDAYDGRAWSRSSIERRFAAPSPSSPNTYAITRDPDPANDRTISFELEPIDPPVIFLPPRAVGLSLHLATTIAFAETIGVQRGPEGELRYAGGDARGIRYDVYLSPSPEPNAETLSGYDQARYLALPPSLPSRVHDLARDWTANITSDVTKARVIEERLRKEFLYDLASPSAGTSQPVDHFLFESHRGHCEFFSTTMALMLRAVGIPSRNVTGFVGGTYNRFGQYYAVREGDAHSWVEAYLSDGTVPAWYTFDPTPPAAAQPIQQTTGPLVYVRDLVEALSQRWSRYVVSYDIRTQVRMVETVSSGVSHLRLPDNLHGLGKPSLRTTAYASIAIGLMVAAILARRRHHKNQTDGGKLSSENESRRLETAAALYRSLERVLAERGVPRPPAVPPLRHAESLRDKDPQADEIEALTDIYISTRFGGAELTPDVQRDFQQRLRALKRTDLPESPASETP